MRNERGSKKNGRNKSSSSRTGSFPKKTEGSKKSGGSKKFNPGFKKDGNKPEKRFSKAPLRKATETVVNTNEGDKSWKKNNTVKFETPDNIKREKKFTPKKSGSFKDYRKKGPQGSGKEKTGSSFKERKEYKRKTGIKTYTDKKDSDKTYSKSTEIIRKKDGSKGFKKTKIYAKTDQEDDGLVRLNKFIANAGICSRREADTFIKTGVVSVNGKVVTELGYKVKPTDRVLFHDKPVIGEKHVYILLNKPKDYITTSKDPQNRKTVYDLVSGIKERVFPVGRLDRNTTGVLLLTNDGQLAEKLMHPRKGITKIYHVELDKKFATPDMMDMKKGVELEDGFFTPDEVDYVEGMDKHHVGVQIHSGANRIVRRMFEAMDYKVVKLDRVVYAGLTKKGLTRGKWRFLKDTEVYALKMM